jgi:pimeloyl-ACP methyl ester carboxylesterase
MRVERIPVAEGVELAVDVWTPAPDEGRTTGIARSTAGGRSAAVGRSAAGDRREPLAFVLVHGLASNARLWDGVAAGLVADGHTVATVDLRGHGRSSKPDGPYDVPTVAHDVAVLVAALGLDRPVVAGQSWGGNVVLEMAAGHPEMTRAIVCVDGGWLEPSRGFPDWETCRRALAPPHLAGRPLAEIERHVRSTHRDWPETSIRGTLANFEVRPDGTVAPWLTYERHLAVLRGLWDHHPSERYADLAVPVLLVPVDGGEADRTARKRHDVDAALAAIPNARARWFAGEHDIHAQRPDELADVMHTMTTDGFFG